MDALRQLIRGRLGVEDTDPGSRAERMLRQLFADGRYLQDVFTTYTPLDKETRLFDTSEVVLRNNPRDGYWMIVSGKVYDMSEFMHVHPGGDKIVLAYTGMDATHAYQQVQHDVNTEVDALLAMYQIGAVRRLELGIAWTVVLGSQGLQFVSARDVFRAWVRLLYLVVEMENALANDLRFLARSMTLGEDSLELTPMKIHMLASAHTRFVDGHLATAVGEDLQTLWAIATSVGAPDQPLHALRQEIDELNASMDARLVRACAEIIDELNEHGLRSAHSAQEQREVMERLRALCALVEKWDQWCLAELKFALREGVSVFEELEGDVIARGGPRLLASIRLIPGVVRDYYKRMAGEMGTLLTNR
jgi:cytochrome b involved in lipid metabolism